MNPGVVAGISFADDVMRYAEVEHEHHGSTLKRLGSCRFDFPVSEALADPNADERFTTVREAVAEIFSATAAHRLSVAIDPRLAYTFETSIEADADDDALKAQVLKELALVADNETPLFVATESGKSGDLDDVDAPVRVTVFAYPERIRTRLAGLAAAAGARLAVTTAIRSAAGMVSYLEDTLRSREDDFSVVVGDHGTFAEFAVCVHGAPRSSALCLVEDPADGVYGLWSFVRRLQLAPRDLDTVYLYGENEADSVFADIPRHCGATLRRLSPLDVVRLASGGSGPQALAAYVPCVGAALDHDV